MKTGQKTIFLSCEFEIVSVDKANGKVTIRNLATALKQPDQEVDTHRVRLLSDVKSYHRRDRSEGY